MLRRLRRSPLARTTFLGVTAAIVPATAAQPVSYSRQIAPILAMNCHACHGANPESAAGGLSTRTWADLNKGGNLGPVIVPGDPERSALFQFVSGGRGEAHRMPLGGPPLSAGQIESIRRWILEGADEDTDATAKYRLELPSLFLDRSKPVRIFGRLPSTGYVELELADSRGRILYTEGGAVKESRDLAAIGTPDEWITWTVRRASDWPAQVRARLTVAYAPSEPANAVLAATEDIGAAGPEFPVGEADIRIVSTPDEKLMFRRREHVSGGLPTLQRLSKGLEPGLYVLHLRYVQARCELAILLRSGN
ncbi:MAG: c-type cytochrome domain-containing protein [Bryobacteraceae bacterium]